MADRDDEIDFSDTALEDLPLSTLQDLEHTAISSTQRQLTATLRSKHYPQVARPYKLSLPSTTWQQTLPDHSAAPAPAPAPPDPPSSDYGFDDEDVIDLDEPFVLAPPHSVAAEQINRPLTAIHTGFDHVKYSATDNVHHPHGFLLPDPAQDLAALNAKTEKVGSPPAPQSLVSLFYLVFPLSVPSHPVTVRI